MSFKADDFQLMKFVPEVRKYTRNNSITFKLRVSPTSADSATLEQSMFILDGSEGVREAVSFRKEIGKVFVGMHANNAAKKDGLVQRVLKGNAMQAYNGGVESHLQARWTVQKEAAKQQSANNGGDAAAQLTAYNGVAKPDKNDDDVQSGIDAMVIYMCPYKALPRIRRWLRRSCRKSVGMTIREFYTHLMRINSDELPNLPPGFNANQSLASDEIVDIVLYAIPNSWKKELDRQGKDPDELGETDLVRLLEQYEAAEQYDTKKSETKKTSSPAKKKTRTSPSTEDKKHFCKYHGWNTTHTSEECKVLKSQGEDAKKKGGYKNKTWSRSKDYNKQELKVLIAEAMQEMNTTEDSSSKKRKISSDEEDSSDNECTQSLRMAEVDFSDMANLKIKEDWRLGQDELNVAEFCDDHISDDMLTDQQLINNYWQMPLPKMTKKKNAPVVPIRCIAGATWSRSCLHDSTMVLGQSNANPVLYTKWT